MYYEVNVARKSPGLGYVHFFATAERSLSTEWDAQRVYREIRSKFPYPEFKVDVTRWDKIGQTVKFKRKKGA